MSIFRLLAFVLVMILLLFVFPYIRRTVFKTVDKGQISTVLGVKLPGTELPPEDMRLDLVRSGEDLADAFKHDCKGKSEHFLFTDANAGLASANAINVLVKAKIYTIKEYYNDGKAIAYQLNGKRQIFVFLHKSDGIFLCEN